MHDDRSASNVPSEFFPARGMLLNATAVENSNGFTLMEAMIAMAVSAILVTVAVPGMTNVYLDNRRAAVVNELASGLQIARSEAISRNQRVVVCAAKNADRCGGDWQQGVLAFADLDQDQNRDRDEPVVFYSGDLRELSITTAGFASFMVYRPNGRMMVATVRDNNGLFNVCDHRGEAHGRSLFIDASGRPRVGHVNSDASGVPAC